MACIEEAARRQTDWEAATESELHSSGYWYRSGGSFVLLAHSTVFYTPLSFFSLQSLCPMHTGKPKGVAVSDRIT